MGDDEVVVVNDNGRSAGAVGTLGSLTPTMFSQLDWWEKRLAERFFASYLTGRDMPSTPSGTPDLLLAATLSYSRARRVLLSVAAVSGMVGGGLISLAAGRAALWVPGALILLVVAYRLIRGMIQAVHIDRYFGGLFKQDPMGDLDVWFPRNSPRGRP